MGYWQLPASASSMPNSLKASTTVPPSRPSSTRAPHANASAKCPAAERSSFTRSSSSVTSMAEGQRGVLISKPNTEQKINLMQTRSERTPTRFYMPNTKTETAISSTLKEMIESSKFRSDSAIRKKPLKLKNVRQIYTDLSNPYKQDELKLKIGSSLKFDCSKDPDVVRAAEFLMELSSGAEFSIFSDEMHPFPQPEVVRLKMRGMPEICVS